MWHYTYGNLLGQITHCLKQLRLYYTMAKTQCKLGALYSKKQTSTLDDMGIKPLDVEDALGDARSEWTLRNVLSAGSLLGKSCQGTLILAGHPTELQEQVYLFGKHLALAWQACLDREPFQGPRNGAFSLISAPVMFQLEHDPSLYTEIEKGPGLEKTRQLQKEHSQAALEVLQQLPESDARTALTNIIVAMEDL
ncbi:Decaprenyl diphosphate synthase subunit 2 [Carabus blaptoides fortunei]